MLCSSRGGGCDWMTVSFRKQNRKPASVTNQKVPEPDLHEQEIISDTCCLQRHGGGGGETVSKQKQKLRQPQKLARYAVPTQVNSMRAIGCETCLKPQNSSNSGMSVQQKLLFYKPLLIQLIPKVNLFRVFKFYLIIRKCVHSNKEHV